MSDSTPSSWPYGGLLVEVRRAGCWVGTLTMVFPYQGVITRFLGHSMFSLEGMKNLIKK